MRENLGRAGPASFAAMAATFCVVGVVVVGQMYATIPMLPALAASWSVSAAETSWATSVFAIAYAVGSLLSGPLSNRWGRRAVMVAGIAAMAVVTAVLPLADDLVTGCLLRAAQGLFAGAFVPMAYAHVTATVPPPRLPTALTMISASMGGTVVIAQVQAQLVAGAVGWRGFFALTAPALALGAVAVHRAMRGPSGEPLHSGQSADRGRLVGLTPLYLVALLVAGTITACYTGVQLAGPAELVNSPGALLALRASALPALLAAVLLAPRLGRFAASTRVAAAFGLATVGLAAAGALADSALGLGIALFLFMLGMSTAGPALVQVIGARAGTAAATTAIALYGFALNLGGGIGARVPTVLTGLGPLALTLAAVLAVATGYLVRGARVPSMDSPDRTIVQPDSWPRMRERVASVAANPSTSATSTPTLPAAHAPSRPPSPNGASR